jgi:hypothetical protein
MHADLGEEFFARHSRASVPKAKAGSVISNAHIAGALTPAPDNF